MRELIYPNGPVVNVEEHCANHWLVKLALVSGSLFLTDASVALIYNGDTYLPSGHLLDAGSLESSAELQVDDIDLELSGADLQMLALLADDHMNRPVTIHRAWIADNYQVMAVDDTLWAGIINNLEEDEEGSSHTLTLNLTNHLATFEQPGGVQLTLSEQQHRFPADTGLRHALVADRPKGEWGHEDLAQGGGLFAKKVRTPGVQIELNVDASAQKLPIIFGTTAVEPTTVYRHITGQDKRYLCLIDALCVGPIKGIRATEILGSDIDSDEGKKRFGLDGRTGNGRPYIAYQDERLGLGNHAAYPWMLNYPAGVNRPGTANFPDFLATDTFDGMATKCLVLRHHKDSPYSGEPERRHIVDGLLVWDPRDEAQKHNDPNTWQWSANPALCVLHFLRMSKADGGWALPLGELIVEDYVNEANWIDTTLVTGSDGKQRPVMSCNLVLDTQQGRLDNLRELYDCCRGRPRWRGGKLGFAINRHRDAVMTLDEFDLEGINLTSPERDKRKNRVTVEYTDAANGYVTNTATWPTPDDPEYAQYLAEDLGLEQSDTIKCPGIDNHDEALQMAEVICRQDRTQSKGTWPLPPRAATLEGGDVIEVHDSDRGWTIRAFEIKTLTVEGSGEDLEVSAEVLTYDPSIFTWRDKPLPPPGPIYQGPNPNEVPQVSGIAYVGPTDTQPQGRIIWIHDDDEYGWTDHYKVTITKNGTQVASGTSPDGDYPIPALDAGHYQVTVVRVSNLSKNSEPVTLGFTLALPAAPVIAPEGIIVDNTSVTLAPATAGLSYGTAFEFAFRGTAADGERAIELRSRGHYIRANLALETRYYFSIRAVNSLGVSDWLEVSATTTRNATVVNDLLDVPPGTSVGESLTQFDRDIGITSWDAFMAAIEGYNVAQETAEQGQTQATLLQGQQLQAEAQSTIAAQVKALQAQTATAEALIAELQRASVFERGAIAEQSTSLTAKIGEAQAESLEYTRTAVGYWEDGNGVIQSETDPEFDAPADWVWREGPLAEVIRKLKIQTANGYASYQQLGQAFETVDGQPRARGGWIIDENGQQTGVVGHAGRLDLLAALLRMGVMVDGQYKSLFELDANTNTLRIVASLVLGDGHTIRKVEDIRGQDGVSPSVSKVGNTVTITAPDGTTVTVSDGSDGYTPRKGIDYDDGADGHTPQKGVDYDDGADGQHGTSHLYIKANNGYLPESAVITSALTTVLGRAPIQGDMVTYYALDASNLPVRANDAVYSGSVWQPFQLVVNGSAIVHGSLRADVLAADSTLTVGTGNNVAVMSGQGSYRLWAGHASAASAPFRVTQSGKVVATDVEVKGKVEATSGSFDNVTINETCTIKKVNAEVIEGDIYLEAFAPGPWDIINPGNQQYKLFGIRVATSVPFARVLQLTSGISVAVNDGTGDTLKRARVELIGPGVNWIGPENSAWLAGPGNGEYESSAQFADPITVTIPANTKGDYTLYLRVLSQSRNPTLKVYPTGNAAGVGVSLYRKGASLTII